MNQVKNVQVDKTYVLMHEIEDNAEITQRELAGRSGLSLGTVNLLLKKMIRQGLLKVESIPANRVVYMLTPVGMAEKAHKTVRYIKHHYRAIEETKQRIYQNLVLLEKKYDRIFIQKSGDELAVLVEGVVREFFRESGKGKVVFFTRERELQEMFSSLTGKITIVFDGDNLNSDKFPSKVGSLSIDQISYKELIL